MKIILDTNVFLSGLQSKKGASYWVLRRLKEFEIVVSVPLMFEYEEILKRELDKNIFTDYDIDSVISYLCKVGIPAPIFCLWCPFLPDPEDDHILELSLATNCDYIVTYNKKDFRGVEQHFNIKTIDAAEFLKILKKKKSWQLLYKII